MQTLSARVSEEVGFQQVSGFSVRLRDDSERDRRRHSHVVHGSAHVALAAPAAVHVVAESPVFRLQAEKGTELMTHRAHRSKDRAVCWFTRFGLFFLLCATFCFGAELFQTHAEFECDAVTD